MAGNQRAAILVVGLFFVMGLILLSRVRAGGPTSQAGKMVAGVSCTKA